eukprot:1336659-Rhodomonas_salina.1
MGLGAMMAESDYRVCSGGWQKSFYGILSREGSRWVVKGFLRVLRLVARRPKEEFQEYKIIEMAGSLCRQIEQDPPAAESCLSSRAGLSLAMNHTTILVLPGPR